MLYKRQLHTDFRFCRSITREVDEIVRESGVQNGLCVVSLPHTTAGLVITSFWDKRGLDDLLDEIDRNIPTRVSYKHQDSPYDASGHVKSALIGSSVTLAVAQGRLVLGSSQGLVFVEFDGPRPRQFIVQVIDRELTLQKRNLQTRYMGMHDLTPDVQEVVAQSGVVSGICHVSVLHSTAGLVVSSANDAVCRDVMRDIERMVPTRVDFKHRETASDAGGHVKTAFTGTQLSFAVEDGRPDLGPDQAIIFAEYDGPRPRSFYIAVVGARQAGR